MTSPMSSATGGGIGSVGNQGECGIWPVLSAGDISEFLELAYVIASRLPILSNAINNSVCSLAARPSFQINQVRCLSSVIYSAAQRHTVDSHTSTVP